MLLFGIVRSTSNIIIAAVVVNVGGIDGQRRSGESLAGYAVSNLTAKISDFDWSVTFYVDNLFDKYAFVSTRAHQGYQGIGDIEINRTDLQRGYGHFLLRPRTVGVTFSYQFEM